MAEETWVAVQRGGVCNNIKCLLSTLRLAGREGGRVVTSSRDLTEIYSNVEYLDPRSISGDMHVHRDWRFMVFDDDPIDDGFAEARESRGFPDAHPKGRNIDHEFSRIPPPMRQIYLDTLAKLEVRDELVQAIDDYAAENLNDDIVAIHMRTWLTDNWDKAPKRHQRYFSLEAYLQQVEAAGSAFVSSDNASLLQQLIDQSTCPVLFYEPGGRFSNAQAAYINLALLARCNRLVGSGLSTFTEMAWWLGGCRSAVTLMVENGGSVQR